MALLLLCVGGAGCGVGALGSGDGTDVSNQDVHGSGSTGVSCAQLAGPDTPAQCTCASGHTCSANQCYGGWYCDTASNRCVAPPTNCPGSSGTTSGASTSTDGASSSTTGSPSGGTTGASCPGYAAPDEAAPCHCASGHSCGANNCYGGWYCELSTDHCVAPPSGCAGTGATTSSGTTSGTTAATTGATSTGGAASTTGTSGGASTTGTSGGTGSGVGDHGGTVSLLHFGMSGDTRPPGCEDTANYPTAIIDAIGDAEKAAGAQFALDLGDHMYVCNNDATVADAQMGLFMQGVSHFGGTWFLTEGNHECMGAGSGSCPTGSTNVNFQAFMSALAPISNTPYYSVDVQTSLGLATFVFIADNSWDNAEQTWLNNTLTTADQNARYTIIAKHHPENDTSVAANTTIMSIIRQHKFALLLTGHAHRYEHQTTDNGRDLILGNGGAPLVSGGTFNGYAMVDQLANGNLQVTVYDLQTGTPHDQWSVPPN